MKKIFLVLFFSALLLLAGCAGEAEAQPTAQKATAPVIQAQNIDYSEEVLTSDGAEGGQKEAPVEESALGQTVAHSEPGDLPTPEPVETTVESAEK